MATEDVIGIDVSRYQGAVDWPEVKEAGYIFVAIRATVGDFMTDPQFYANWNGAKDAGMLVTAYHVVDPLRTPQSQVAHFMNTLNDRVPDLPLVLDCELDRGLAKQKIQANIEAQVRLLPMTPLIYTNQSFGNNHMLGNCGCELWVANYTAAPEPRLPKWWQTWRLWQHSCTGRIPGIDGDVDLDRFNGNRNEFMTWLGLTPDPDPLLVWAHEIDAWARFEGYTGIHPPEIGG